MLPPVLPIVLYNGDVPWRAATEIQQLIPALPPELQAYSPKLSYILIDEERDLPELEMDNLLTHLMRFAHAIDAQDRDHHLAKAQKLVQNDAKLNRHIRSWLQALWVQKGLHMTDAVITTRSEEHTSELQSH